MNKGVLKALTMVTQIGISMLVPILLCIFLGVQLDAWLNTSFFLFLLVIIGVLASFRNVYYLTKNFYKKDVEKEDAKLKYYEDLKKERSNQWTKENKP